MFHFDTGCLCNVKEPVRTAKLKYVMQTDDKFFKVPPQFVIHLAWPEHPDRLNSWYSLPGLTSRLLCYDLGCWSANAQQFSPRSADSIVKNSTTIQPARCSGSLLNSYTYAKPLLRSNSYTTSLHLILNQTKASSRANALFHCPPIASINTRIHCARGCIWTTAIAGMAKWVPKAW